MTTFKRKSVITRKEHKCMSCYRKFPEKSKMTYWAGIFDGEFGYNYTCSTCEEIINKHWDEYEIPEGCVYEWKKYDQSPEDFLIELDSKLNVTS